MSFNGLGTQGHGDTEERHMNHWSPGSLSGVLRVPIMGDMRELMQEI